jgi:mannose-6-phosphate isomerase-like protein (cupin superfamily)
MRDHKESDRAYHEFLRVPALNAGIYVLRAGEPDPQQPHEQDEIYYVTNGTASFACDGHKDQPVTTGAVIYVEKGVAHRFYSITEDLTLLVVFAG